MTLLLALLLAADSTIPGMAPAPGVPTLLQSGVPEAPHALRERALQYLNTRSAALMDVSDDASSLLITTRFASTAQLHLVESPLGARTQVTFRDEPVNDAHFAPGDPKTIWYLQDVGGAEFFQIFRLDRRTGRAELVTDGKSRHGNIVLSRGGKLLAFSGTGRNGKDTDVYIASTAAPRDARRVTSAAGSWSPVEFSRDGTKLLVLQERSISDADLHELDVASGAVKQLTPKDSKASVLGAAYAQDGVYVVTDRYADFNQLMKLGADGKPQLIGKDLKWDVEQLAVSNDGARAAFITDEDGVSKLYTVEGSNAPKAVPLPRNALVGAMRFPRSNPGVLTLSIGMATQPSDAYQLDLRTGQLTRWTRSETGGIDTAQFVDAALVRYPSKDVTVPAFLYKPRSATGKLPVVIIWHGGPESQQRPNFYPLVQLMVNELGVAVLLPNVRGSAGYGKASLASDDGVKREQALQDIGATLDFIKGQPDLDASRVAAYGGSYGGYMTLATVAFYGQRVKAAVDIVGISNLVTFLQNTQAYRRDLRRAEYGDERDPAVRAVQERISPLNSVDKISAEMFVVQGHNDPR
ncbi:MAG TPA: prolyl oligopeptidase family serine peptidase, partial [Myxococcales bacterium]|nr:prolyl oligopeptidase family serine peptidase [Myxococcales bacterium]